MKDAPNKYTSVIESPSSDGECTLPSTTKRVLIVRTDAIGDNVLAASVLEPLQRHLPDAQIAIVCQARTAPLYQSSPCVKRIFVLENSSSEILDRLEREVRVWNAEVVINSAFSRDTLSDLISAWSPAALRIGFEGDGLNTSPGYEEMGRSVYTTLIRDVDQWLPELHKYDLLLSQIGVSTEACAPKIWHDPAAEALADDLFRQLNINADKAVVFAPGARSNLRTYERFAETFAMLADLGYVLIVLGDAHDELHFRRSISGIEIPYVSLCGETTLMESAAIIARSRLFIGPESGPGHIACAVGTPNVIVLGCGHLGRFMPYSPLTSAVVLPLACAGCNWSCRYETAACVKDIDPEVIKHAVADRLKANSYTRPQIYLSTPSIAQRGLRMYPALEGDLERFCAWGDVMIAIEGEEPRPLITSATPNTSNKLAPIAQ